MPKAIRTQTKPRTRTPRVVREKSAAYKVARLSLTRAEQRALAEFRARLHEILPNGELKSLILYGSKARGDPRPGSDIDLLIVYDSARSEIQDEIYDALSEIQMDWFERDNVEIPIQPLVQTAVELKQAAARGEPLLQNVAREGIVLEGEPIMPEAMDRKHYSSFYIEQGKRTLQSARLIVADGDFRHPVSMAFDIYEQAMRAALIAKDIAPQSHEGTASLFGLHFVKPGLVPRKFAVHFDRMVKNRLNADYHPEIPFDREDAERALERAEELLNIIENLLPKLLAEK